MDIESQLTTALTDRVKKASAVDRNVEVIIDHFGFRGDPQPTLEEIGKKHGVTRERVRQIIAKDFQKLDLPVFEIPSLKACLDLIQSRDYWLYADLTDAILNNGLAGDHFHIEGILNLASALGNPSNYVLYTPMLEEIKRGHFSQVNASFVLRPDLCKRLKPLLQTARKLPGKYGIAKLNYLKDEITLDDQKVYSSYLPLIKLLIEYSAESWSYEYDGELWYSFEDSWNNPIANFSKKVFSVFEKCNKMLLAEVFFNALHSRSRPLPYPSTDLIGIYFETSKRFEIIEDQVTYLGEKSSDISEIDQDIISYLQVHGSSSFVDLKEHLYTLNYKHPYIVKSTMRSPFVYVDRSQGNKNNSYSLVGSSLSTSVPSDYNKIRRRLMKLENLGNSDKWIETKARREQHILKDWLFGKKSKGQCAICGETYPIVALVAAHKKRRSICVESERLDPYIVMPLCKFGCDFLYEERFLTIEPSTGQIKEGSQFQDGTLGSTYLNRLVGRKIDNKWLRGLPSYFNNEQAQSLN